MRETRVPITHWLWGSHSTLLAATQRASRSDPAEGRRHLINVFAKLRLYRYSKKMVPFISVPSAQAHLLLPRQPTRTQ